VGASERCVFFFDFFFLAASSSGGAAGQTTGNEHKNLIGFSAQAQAHGRNKQKRGNYLLRPIKMKIHSMHTHASEMAIFALAPAHMAWRCSVVAPARNWSPISPSTSDCLCAARSLSSRSTTKPIILLPVVLALSRSSFKSANLESSAVGGGSMRSTRRRMEGANSALKAKRLVAPLARLMPMRLPNVVGSASKSSRARPSP